MSSRFRRTIKKFTCAHCGTKVVGDGYTNHCPKCLWSKHVDVNPGDRLEACGGLMMPERVEGSSPHYDIIHQCLDCGRASINKVNTHDDSKAIVALAEKKASS